MPMPKRAHAFLFCICFSTMTVLLSSCSQDSSSRARAMIYGLFEDDDLGKPDGGLADESAPLLSLLNESGADLVVRTTTDSELVTSVEKGTKVPLPANSELGVIAENGDWLRVLAEFPQANGATILKEGFVPKSAVQTKGRQSEGVSFGHAMGEIVGSVESEAGDAIDAGLSSKQYPVPGNQGNPSIELPVAGPEIVSGIVAGASGVFDQGRMEAVTENAEPIVAGSNEGTNASVMATPAEAPAPTEEPVTDSPLPPAPNYNEEPQPAEKPVANEEAKVETSAIVEETTPPVGKAPAEPKPEEVGECRSASFKMTGTYGPSLGSRVPSMNCQDGQSAKKCTLPGEILREPERRLGKRRTAAFHLEGKADKWIVKTDFEGGGGVKSFKRYDIEKTQVFRAKGRDGVTTLDLVDVVAENEIVGGTRVFEFIPKIDGKEGKGCTIKMAVVSPLVLDLENKGVVDDIHLSESNVRFDLRGNDRKVQTGWVKPTMGFLAHDLNGDGLISSGRELFGEGTRDQNGQPFENGFLALASLDDNGDGMISALDRAFKDLLVWRDHNLNGLSEKEELVSVGSLGISAFSLSFGPSFRHGVPALAENDVRWEARYIGPETCPKEGCLLFDIYFMTVQSMAGL